MGLSLAVANALIALPIAWLNTKSPGFGAMIAKRDYAKLDQVFKQTLIFTMLLLFSGGCFLIVANQTLQNSFPHIASRFLPFGTFSMLIVATMVNYITLAQATYLRAHKKEPFLALSVVSGVAISLSTLFTARTFGSFGVVAGYLACVVIIGFGWGTYIFIAKRQEYRSL